MYYASAENASHHLPPSPPLSPLPLTPDPSHASVHCARRACASLQAPQLAIVLEFAERGSLHDVLCDRNVAPHPWARHLQRAACDVAAALAFVHERGFLHADIKTANVLMSRSCRASLADFGCARSLADRSGTGNTGHQAMSTLWASPEALRGEARSLACDIWSFGILLWECDSLGERPWGDTPMPTVVIGVSTGETRIRRGKVDR